MARRAVAVCRAIAREFVRTIAFVRAAVSRPAFTPLRSTQIAMTPQRQVAEEHV